MKLNSYLLALILVILGISCRSTRDVYTAKGELKNIPDAKLISSVEEGYLDFNTLFLKKFKAELTFNGEKKSFKGNMFINRDSSITVSINPLMGIELFRVRLSPGNVEIIDRTKKQYSQGDYKILWEKFLIELDYYTLQHILTNQLFPYPIGDFDKTIKRYKHYVGQDAYQLQSLKEGRYNRIYKKDKTDNVVFHQFSILPDVFRIRDVSIRDFEVNSQVSIAYEDFQLRNNALFPSKIVIDGKRGWDSFSLGISFEHIDIDGEHSLGFKISNKYKKTQF
ncbi:MULTISPECIES: DUF4292 domain-containing protein [unclassified Carboxylicivirga]|uniref:DUF4292 domain-containing protein n=1 Tax=Carboxylicivirga TaxID=1628153 RepID=UPI003D332307